MKVGEAFVEIRPDTHGFQAEAERGIGGPIKKLAGLAAGAFAGVAVAGFLKDSIAQAQEAAKVTAQTSAVIKSTGAAAHVTAGQVSEFAESLSRKTAIDDEAIQSGQNMLLTFTNIRNEAGKGNDIFNQASSAIVDLSVAMGTDAKGAAIQVGKALNDPIKGITALTRVGVTFTDQQKDQIKSMVAAGDTMGAQKVILAELNKEFGGSAAAQATPLDKLKVAWANLKEEVGTKVLAALAPVATFLADKIPGALDAAGRAFGPLFGAFKQIFQIFANRDFVGGGPFAEDAPFITGLFRVRDVFVDDVLPVVRRFADFVRGNLKPLLASIGVIVLTAVVPPFLAWAAATVVAALPFVALAAAVLGAIALVQRFPVILDVLKAAMAAVGAAFVAVAGFFVSLWPQISEAFSHGVNTIVGIVRPFIALIVGAWRLFGDDILVIVRAAWGYVQATIQNALAVVENVIRLGLALINGDWGKAWDALKGIVGAFVSQIQAALRAGLGLLRGIFGAAFDAARTAVVASVGALVSYVAGIPGRIKGAIGDLGGLLVEVGRQVIAGLIRGLDAATGGLLSKAHSIVDKVLGVFKSVARVFSPSKITTYYGEMIGQGLANGLAAMEHLVAAKAARLATAALPKLEDQPGWDWATQGNKSRGVLIGGRMYTQHADGTITDDHPFADNQAFIEGAIRKGVAQLPDSVLQAGRADVGGGDARTLILQWVVNGKVFAEETVDVFADALRRRDKALA